MKENEGKRTDSEIGDQKKKKIMMKRANMKKQKHIQKEKENDEEKDVEIE